MECGIVIVEPIDTGFLSDANFAFAWGDFETGKRR
jgi:hypothetical protein